MTPQIYGITGLKGHGKDSLAEVIADGESDWLVTHFAASLKEMVKTIFGLSDHQVHTQEGKKSLIDPIHMDDYLSSMSVVTGLDITSKGLVADSPRLILQFFGTDYVRAARDSYWFDLISSKIQGKGRVLIPDLRFLNEEEFLRSINAKVIRVTRLDATKEGKEDLHPSEQEALKIKADLHVGTRTDKFTLQREVGLLLNQNRFEHAALYYHYESWLEEEEARKSGNGFYPEKVFNLLNNYYTKRPHPLRYWHK